VLLDPYLNIPIQPQHKIQQLSHRELLKLPTQETGNFGLINSQQLSGFGLIEMPVLVSTFKPATFYCYLFLNTSILWKFLVFYVS